MQDLTKEEIAFVIDCLKGQASVSGLSKPWILDLIAKIESN